MAQTWVCVVAGRAGAHARAVFSTKDQARPCAERHARAMAPGGLPLKWEDTSASLLLSTLLGDCRIAPSREE